MRFQKSMHVPTNSPRTGQEKKRIEGVEWNVEGRLCVDFVSNTAPRH